MIAQLPNPSSFVAMGWVLTAIIALITGVGGSYLVYLNILVAKKKLAAPPLPTGQQPQPFVVKEAEIYVKTPDFDKTVAELKEEIGAVEGRLDEKLAHNETIFRERFHSLDEELNSISINARNLGEKAGEEFKKIEGKLGELKSTSQHITALAVRTDQSVRKLAEDLPDKIASAIQRTRQT